MDVPIVKLWNWRSKALFCYQFIIFSVMLFFAGASLLIGYMEIAIDDVLTVEEQQELYKEVNNAPELPETFYQAYDLLYSGNQSHSVWEHFYNMGSLNQRGYSHCIFLEIFNHYSINDKKLIHKQLAKFVVALELEEKFTKRQCINALMAKQDFLMNSVGAEMAALNYFKKTLNEINLKEATILVKMCKNPILYRKEALTLAEKKDKT